MKEAFEKIRKRMKEQTDFLSDCTKYGNKDAEQQRKSYDTMHMYEIADMVENLIDIVSEVEAEYGNGWIDVKDRLPEKDGYYLTCDHKGNIHVFFHSQEFKETAPFGICEHHSRYYQPIAWMELPKPYTGKKGE